MKTLLLGNTFPLGLVRRRVLMEPVSLAVLQSELAGARVFSFWGHGNTMAAASALLGVDVSPADARPALTLEAGGWPRLDGETFRECWVLSPDYASGFRPAPGETVPPEKIMGWQVLKITFPE